MNNLIKDTFTIFLAIIFLFAASSCKEEKKYKIAVSQCSQDDWRDKINDEIMREALFYDDVEVEIRSANDDNSRQIEDLRYFAANDFDLIIAAPNEAAALTPIIDSIYSTGKPVIVFDRNIDSDNYTLYQGADNKSIGHAAAKYALTLNAEPKVLEIEGNLSTSPARERHSGFKEVADSAPNMRLLASVVGDWIPERAREGTDSLLALYPETNVVYAHNDRMALGVAEAVKKSGRKDIKIIGIDASPSIGLKAVMDSVIDATFIYPTEGRRLIKSALAILNGEKLEKNVIIPTRTAVDQTNAEILLLQDEALKVETNNIKELKQELDSYWKQHSLQTIILYGSIAFIILLGISIFLLLRSFWIQRKHREVAEAQNAKLQEQRDQIESQYKELSIKNEEINDILHKLQQATQSKLNFFTNVSHDLRTPLTLIAEPVDQLSHADNLNDEQKKLLTLASKNAKVLMRLINQILDFRKYENDRLDLQLTETNIAADLKDWTESFQLIAARKHIKFNVEVEGNQEDYTLAIDTDKIERVLFNLLSNAFKFTLANGRIGLRLSKDTKNVCIRVEDNGSGISSQDIEKVFNRFYKTDKVNPHGSGIGLALAKAFVELHGGSIEVQSKEGVGTRFTVLIPIRHTSDITEADRQIALPDVTVAELDEVETPEMPPSESERTILVIDDNRDICTLLKTLLQDKFRVIQAHDGTAGIKIATKYVPDLVICDVMMPGKDGYETCRRLKSEITTSHIPVLLLTACALDEQKAEGYDCGADAYLTKPFNSKVLFSMVGSLLENRRRLKEAWLAPDSGLPILAKEIHKKSPASPADIESDFYRRFCSIVEQKMADSNLGVDEIASEFGISRIQLYRKLKSLTNYSPTDLMRIIRLKKASMLLKTTESTVSEVGYAVGFASHSYFTKCYREYFGESPSDVQKRTSKLK